ncbi:MAG: hypothetical protein JXA62_00520 [Candidatus Aminicenantes bacterium]|nr:hypothetical protein [Candidatus Aminicenantes bacterium]
MQKKLRLSALVVLVLFALLVVPIMRYRKEANLTSLPSRFIKGVVASAVDPTKMSADRETICRAANELALQFVILSPDGNIGESFSDAASWCKNTLIIESPAKIADIDLVNLYDSLRKVSRFSRVIHVSRYLFNSSYALLSAIDHPRDSLSQWDLNCRTGRKTGVFSLGTEGGLSLPGVTKSTLPSFRSMFEILTVYVRIDRELVKEPGKSMEMVMNAVKAGHFFNAIEAIAAANGFDARFYPVESADVIQMGDMDPRFQGKLQVDTPFTFPTRVMLIRNGEKVATAPSSSRGRSVWDIANPGIYRVEVYVPGNHFANLPWIVTNPFYLGTANHLANRPSGSE